MTPDFPTAPPAYGLNGPSAAVTVEKSPHASHTEILTTPRVPITPRHLKDDCDFLATNQLLLHLQAIQVECIMCRQQTHWTSGVVYYWNMSESPFVHY